MTGSFECGTRTRECMNTLITYVSDCTLAYLLGWW
jgi:hypothetical protein